MPPTSQLPILAPRVQNAFLRDFHTALDDKFNLTNNGAGNLADIPALVFKHLDNPEPSRSGDATETTLAPGYFCTRRLRPHEPPLIPWSGGYTESRSAVARRMTRAHFFLFFLFLACFCIKSTVCLLSGERGTLCPPALFALKDKHNHITVMKLHLPHKFQAALMAALASVSFTTLSSGTIAVATGAALLAGQQAQAADTVLTNVITVGTTKDTDYNSDVWGGTGGIITSATGRYSISGKDQDHTDTAYTNSFLAPETNIGTGNPYVFTLTFHTGTFDEPQTLSSINVDFLTYDSGGKAHANNDCAIKCDWTLSASTPSASGSLSSVALPHNNHGGQTSAAYTKNADGTYTTLTYAGGTGNIELPDFQLESDKTYTLTLGVSKSGGPQGFFVGIGNIAFLYTPESLDYTWAATTPGTDWMAENAWTKDGEGATFTANGNATFGASGTAEVGVSSSVVANAVTVSGQNYTFNLSNGGSLTANALTVESGLAITGAGTVSAATIAAAGKTISLDSGVTLRDVTTGQGTLTGAGTYVASSASNVLAGLDTGTGWTGTIDATVVDGGTNLLDLLTNTHIHGGMVQLKSLGSAVAPGGTETSLQTNLANQGRTGNFTLANTTFTTGGAMRFNDWQNNHVWTVGSGSALQVGGDLWMDHGNKLAIGGGSVTVGGKLLLGHSGGNKPTGLEMSGAGASLKADWIAAYSSSASPQIPVSITGGTVEFTASGNALQINNSAVCDVTIGGSGSDYVTLKADGVSWSLAHAGMTVGNITAETTNGGAITLGSQGKSATYTGALNITNGSSLTLAGTIARSELGSIDVTGTLTLANSVVFDLTNFTHASSTGAGTYTIFSGSSAVDLSGYGFSVANITGFSGEGQATDYGWTFNANGTISYSTSVVYGWNGTQGEWMAENAWTKNDEQVTFVSSPNSDAQFGTATGESFVKDIAVNSAVVVHDITVGDAYTFTLGNGASIAASTIAVDGEGAALTFNGTGTVTTMGISASGKTITVDRGILLQGGTADSFNLDGSGTYALGSGVSALGSVTLGDSWTGTLKFSSVASFANINLNTADFKNTSAVEFDGVTGFWCSGTNEYTRQLILSGQGLTVSEGYSSGQYYFDGGVSGSGDMNFSRSTTVTQNLHFRKDISGWTGSLNVLNGFTVNANFSGQATDVYAGISRTGGTLNVNVGDGTNAFTTTFHNTVGASALTVKAQANATFNEAVTLTGDINLNGNSTATFKKAVNAGGTLVVGDNKSTGASATFEDTLQLGALKLNGTEAVPSSVVLKGDTTVTGTFDISNGGNVRGGVELASGKTLDLQGTIWMNSHTSIALEQDAQVKMGGDLTVAGLAGGGSTVTCGADTSFGLANSNFTFTNVQATVNSDQNDVQVKFDNSKFATSHMVTLKNLQSVFRGMDITGGTTTVGASGLTESATVTLGAVSLSNSGTLALADHVTGSVSGVEVAGSGTVSGGTLKMGKDALITLGDNAVLTLSGVTVDLGSKELQGGGTRYDYGQNPGNGFAITEGKVQLVDYAAGSSISEGTGVSYMFGSNSGTLITEGDDKGYVTFGDASYSAFYVNMAGTVESLSAAIDKSIGQPTGPLTEVYLKAGTLNTDGADPINALHIDSGAGTVYLTGAQAGFATLDGSGTLNVAAATNLNGGTLSVAAGDTLTLEGGATISYSHIANHGTLGIGAGTKVATTNNIVVNAGETFTTTGEGKLTSTAELKVLGGDATLGSKSEWSAIRMGNGSLNINADTTVSGMVELGPESGQMSGNLTVSDGATLTANQVKASWGYSTMAINGIVNATEQFSIATGSSNEVTGTGIINTAKLDVSNVTVKATFKGGLTINIGNGGITGDRPLELQDVTIGVLDGSNGWSASRAITLGSADTGTTFNIGDGKAVTLSGVLSGSGKLNVTGGGTLALNGGNSFSGGLTVTGTTVEMGNNNALGNANNAITIGQGGVIDLKGHDNVAYAYTLAGGTLQNTGNATGAGMKQTKGLTLTENSTIGGTEDFHIIAGDYAATTINLGSNTLAKTGDNTVHFVNSTITEGTLQVDAGALDFRTDHGSNTVKADIVLNGGGTALTGGFKYADSETVVSRNLTVNQSATTSAAIEIGSNVTLATNVATGQTLTMSGALTGNGGLTKTGDGTLALTAAASYNGATAVNAGNLALGSSLTTTGDVTVAAGAAITFANGATITANSLGLEAGSTLDFSAYQGAIGSKVNVVTTTTGVTGYDGASIFAPTAVPHGMTANVAQEGNNIVLTFQAKEDATMHLYILTGQSNSLGAVKGTPLPSGMLEAYQSGALLWNGNMHKDRPSGADTNRYIADPGWQVVAPQEPGLTINPGDYGNNPCMGPEYGFSYIMENKAWAAAWLGADSTLAVVKGSLDGGGNGYWLQNNNAYQTLLDNVKLSIQDAVALGYSNISLDGLMYLQGESNTLAEANIAGERFTNFIGYLKTDLQSWLTQNPELTGVTLSFDSNAVTGEPATWTADNKQDPTAKETVTANQFIALATEDGKINADQNGYGFVYTRDLAKITSGDNQNVHYRGTAQLTIGARYAYAFAVQNGIDVGTVRGQDDSATLDTGAAWWMETAPTAADVAVWDISSVSQSIPVPECNKIADGQTLTVGGIRIEDVYSPDATVPGTGSVAITGGILEIGNAALDGSGITLVGGDLSITSAVHAVANQTWQAAEGHKLAVNGTTTIGDGATLTLEDGLHLTFGAITGTGNLEIGTVTFDMDLDYMLANGLGKYISSAGEGDNGFFTGNLDLVRLTGANSAITFTGEGGSIDNITKAGELASHTLALSADGKALQLTDLEPDEVTYFTRKGEVTYTSNDTKQYGIYTADRVLLSGSVEQPATLKLASALKEGVTIVASGLGGTVNIEEGVTLAATSVNAAGGPVTITGSGVLVGRSSGSVGGLAPADVFGTGVTLSTDWTGTVKITDSSIPDGNIGIKLNELGNENSVVEFENVTGFLNTSSYTYTPNIKFTGAGLNLNAGASDQTFTFSGDVTGDGTFHPSFSRGSDKQTFVFAGDVEGWNGQVLVDTNKTVTVKFSGKADTVNATIKQTAGTLTLHASTATTFNGAISGLSSFVVDANKSASVLGGIDTAATTLNGGASLTIGGTANSSLGNVTLNNNSALTIGGTGAVTAGNVKVADQCAASIILGNDFSVSQLDTIGANKTLSIGSEEGVTKTLTTGALGFDNVGTVISLQNVNMVVTGAATAGVLDAHTNNQGTMKVGTGATLDLQGTTAWNTSNTKYVDLVISDGGAVSVTGGAENTLHGVNLGAGSSLTFGTGTTTTIGGAVVLANTINNDGTLTLSGTVNLDALTAIYEAEVYKDGKVFGNGFYAIEADVRVFTAGHVGTVNSGDATITFKNGTGTIDEDGLFHTEDEILSTFYVRMADSAEDYSHAYEKAGASMTAVSLANATTINMDKADAALAHLVLTENASATVQVSENATIASVEGVGAGQTLTVAGTTGKVLTLTANNTMTGTVDVQGGTLKTTTETTLGNAHVDVAAAGTLELGANLTLANGMDNAGTISMAGKTLTLNGQDGRSTYNLGTITGNDSTNLIVNANADAVFTGNATMHHVQAAANSTVTVEETATLTLTNTADRSKTPNHSAFYDLDNRGTISIKGNNGDLHLYGTGDGQVFNVGRLHIDGTTGTSYMLTAGSVNYTTDIVVKSLTGGGASHTLQVTDCYNGGTQGQVIDFIIGEAQVHSNLYEGKIQYGIGTSSAKAGSGMNVVLKDELVASKAVLDTIFSGNNAQSATITVDTAHAKVKGLTGTATATRSMQVSGTEADKNRVLEIVGEGNYTYGGKLGANLDVVHSGSGTQSFGGVDGFDGSIDVEDGTLNILNIAQATSVSAQDVTINNSNLGVYTNATAAEENVGALTVKGTLTASGENAKLNANLVMDAGSTLDVSAYGGMGGLNMGCTVTLNPGMSLSDNDMEGVAGLGFMDAYDLYYDVESFSIGTTPYSEITFDSETWVKASEIFNNDALQGKDYYVFYSGVNPGGNGGNVGTIYIVQVPEPTTSTLSLLALCALAARRRRKA